MSVLISVFEISQKWYFGLKNPLSYSPKILYAYAIDSLSSIRWVPLGHTSSWCVWLKMPRMKLKKKNAQTWVVIPTNIYIYIYIYIYILESVSSGEHFKNDSKATSLPVFIFREK